VKSSKYRLELATGAVKHAYEVAETLIAGLEKSKAAYAHRTNAKTISDELATALDELHDLGEYLDGLGVDE
jgi:hypothetical protein